MAITLEQIVEETRHWPAEKLGELVDRLTQELNPADPEARLPGKRKLAGDWPKLKMEVFSPLKARLSQLR